MKVLKEMVLIRPVKPDKVTKSGFLLSNTDSFDNSKGQVMSIGEDVYNVEVNDIVIWKKMKSNEIDYEGIKYIVVNQEDIIGVI